MKPLKTPIPGTVPAERRANEAKRLDALRSYEVLDTPPEALFDDLVLIASAICQTPIALISLIDDERQFFKAKVGIEATETPRDVAFCAHAILNPSETLIVPDATADARFATNPLVTNDPSIRFYAGVPLVTGDGLALGTLCAIDRKPRVLTTEQLAALEALARQVVAQLELRRTVKSLKESLTLSRDTPAPISQVRAPADVVATSQRARDLLAQGANDGKMENRLRELLGRLEELQKRPSK